MPITSLQSITSYRAIADRRDAGSRRLYRGARAGGQTAPFVTMPMAILIITIVAILARWVVFGNPVVQIDEEFYLLVGDRMLHGALPYVDIWDRKPIGLFLLFSGIRLLGGEGVLQYQIVALGFVVATATILFAMARRAGGGTIGGLGAALLYVLFLDLAGGEGGQAPVWYNLPVAAAIAIIFFARDGAAARGGDLRRPGIAAMALFGIALQIKYSAVFEGMFAGLALIAISVRNRRPMPSLAVDVALWIGCALVPTLLAAGAYAAMGHLGDWIFANATSILNRGAEMPVTIRMRVRVMISLVAPLALAIPLRRWVGATPPEGPVRDDLRFLDAWAASALLGVVLFGTWFNHYALPLFAPFAVTVAPLARRRYGACYFVALLVAVALWGQHILQHHLRTRGDGSTLAAATDAARDHKGCIFVYDGMPALYYTTHSCFLTTRSFPAHLQSKNEMGATGIDQPTEVRRVMALRPDRVMTMEPAYAEENLAARAQLYAVLKPHYHVLYRYAVAKHQFVVYGLDR